MENKELAHKVLQRWQAIELLSPVTVPDEKLPSEKNSKNDSESSKSVKYFSWSDLECPDSELPWIKGEVCQIPKKEFTYNVYIGLLALSELASKIHAKVGRSDLELGEKERIAEEERPKPKSKDFTCFAKLQVTERGECDFSTLSVSSLPWALSQLEKNGIEGLSYTEWAQANEELKKILESLGEFEGEEEGLILSLDGLKEIHSQVVTWASIDFEALSKSEIVLCIETTLSKREANDSKKGRDDESKESDNEFVPILNSFFLPDLELAQKAIQSDYAGKALRQYLGLAPVKRYPDLYKPEGLPLIYERVQPDKTPPGRWLSEPKYGMALMQQFAVNTVFSDLAGGFDGSKSGPGGLLSVNGPPGTGKTTLLSDIVAANIVQRAEVLAGFDGPADTLDADGNINPKLTGFEMLVASCNNAAVENISKELPLRQKIADVFKDASYLEPLAVMQQSRLEKDNPPVPPKEANKRNWGLVAAVMGKSENVSRFTFAFLGKREVFREDGSLIASNFWNWRKDRFTDNDIYEKGARENFKKFSDDFNAKNKEYKNAFNEISELYKHVKCIKSISEKIERINAKLERVSSSDDEMLIRSAGLQSKIEQQTEVVHSKVYNFASHKRHLRVVKERVPRWMFFKKLFKIKEWVEYQNAIIEGENKLKILDLEVAVEKSKLADLKVQSKKLARENQDVFKARSQLESERDLLIRERSLRRKKLDELRSKEHCTMVIPDDFNKIDDPNVQRYAPWQNEQINKARSELLKAALSLHEAWLGWASMNGVFRENLIELSKALGKSEASLKHWQLLFMIVPVISTTFASLGRMLQSVPAEGLGWLLIDEAGQAPPHQAVGGLLRAKNVLVVGDPLQVEPVVTTPAPVLKAIMEHKMPVGAADDWSPDKQSVQTLADRVNPYGCEIGEGETAKRVGIPLWVHRRCIDPMFSIANEIAYEGRMVHGHDLHGPDNTCVFSGATWFDTSREAKHFPKSTAQKQYRPEEGAMLVEVVSKLVANGLKLNDIFVISPFRMIAVKLREHVKRPDTRNKLETLATAKVDGSQDGGEKDIGLEDWADDNIGTVHTFQGKESKAVILVLGCDESRKGAIAWATSTPNILNVAVTRAKQHLYIIGPRDLWKDAKGFDVVLGAYSESEISMPAAEGEQRTEVNEKFAENLKAYRKRDQRVMEFGDHLLCQEGVGGDVQSSVETASASS